MCDIENLYYNLKDELLRIYKEAETPFPKVKITNLQCARLCGLANLAKLILYLERDGYVQVENKEQSFQEWEVQIEASILDFMFGS
ncbi:hypothetical protein [Thermocrinis sp.]